MVTHFRLRNRALSFSGEPVAVPAILAPGPDPATWLEAVPGRPLEFRTRAGNAPLTLIPLNRVLDERFAVYWTVTARNA